MSRTAWVMIEPAAPTAEMPASTAPWTASLRISPWLMWSRSSLLMMGPVSGRERAPRQPSGPSYGVFVRFGSASRQIFAATLPSCLRSGPVLYGRP